MTASDGRAAQECAEAVVVVTRRLTRRMRELGEPGGPTPSQRSVLSRLDRDGPATVVALANAERVRSQSMTATVNALEERGLVTREPDADDGRRRLVTMTDEGLDLLRTRRAVRTDWLTRALQEQCSAEELRALRAAVELLGRVADE